MIGNKRKVVLTVKIITFNFKVMKLSYQKRETLGEKVKKMNLFKLINKYYF